MHFTYFWRILTDKRFRAALRYRLPPNSGGTIGNDYDYYLTTATIIKNEARFLQEFVVFHQLAGVDHMLIYDDESEDEVRGVLLPFIESGFVELIPWPRFQKNRNGQFLAYQHAIGYMRRRSHWLAMIDCDEFLFSPSGNNLKDELRKREKFPAIGVYSRTFGTSGLDEIPDGGLVLEYLTKRPPDGFHKNRTQRTVVQPMHATAVRSANAVILATTSGLGWDEAGEKILKTGEECHSAGALRINHYFTRARGDFNRKIARQYFGKAKWSHKMQGKSNEADEMDTENITDTEIQKFLPRLKECLLQINTNVLEDFSTGK